MSKEYTVPGDDAAARKLEALAQRVAKILTTKGFPERGEPGPAGLRGPEGPPDPAVARKVADLEDAILKFAETLAETKTQKLGLAGELYDLAARVDKARGSDAELATLVETLSKRLEALEKKAAPIIETAGALKAGGGFPIAKPAEGHVPVGSAGGIWTTIHRTEIGSGGPGGGAPTGADYLVGTAHGDLSAEIVVGTTPGGELGNTWASPTVDIVHAGGSSHAQTRADAEATARAELLAHTSDTVDAHDASAISVLDTAGQFTGADVETVLAEVQDNLDAHLADTTDAHDASAVSVVPFATIAATNVQTALEEIVSEGGGGGPPSGSAGGVLDGTYPNPGIAASVAGSALVEGDNVLHVLADGLTIEVSDDRLRVKGASIAGSHLVDTYVPTSRTLTAGAALTGGGDLSANRTFDVAVDGATIEISDDQLRVKGSSIAGSHLAFDPATQAELDAHISDSFDAHDASTISFVASGDLVATEVQAALQELDTEKVAKVTTVTAGDGLSGGGDLSANRSFAVNVDGATIEISGDALRVKGGGIAGSHLATAYVPTSTILTAGSALIGGGDLSQDRVFHVNPDQATIEISDDMLRVKGSSIAGSHLAFDPATQAELDAHINDSSDAHDASAISSVAAGTLSSTDVQAALNELDTEKVPTVRTVTAGDGLSGGGDLSANISLAVNVDGSTLEIDSDALRIKASGVGSAHLSSAVLAAINDHSTRHETGGADPLAGSIDARAMQGLRKNSAEHVYARRRFNFIEGSNVTLTLADDPSNDEVDVTFAAAGGGASDSRRFQVQAFPVAKSIVVGDDALRFFVSNDMDGMNLIDADIAKMVSGGGGTVTVQVRNVTQGVDMLSTRMTIDPHEFTSYTAAAAPVIDTANDDIATGDILAIDVDDSGIGGSAIGPRGLNVTLEFQTP